MITTLGVIIYCVIWFVFFGVTLYKGYIGGTDITVFDLLETLFVTMFWLVFMLASISLTEVVIKGKTK